jgi:hypothetical protein
LKAKLEGPSWRWPPPIPRNSPQSYPSHWKIAELPLHLSDLLSRKERYTVLPNALAEVRAFVWSTHATNDVEITRLPSGLIVASDPMPHLMSAALGVWVNCGARHETPPKRAFPTCSSIWRSRHENPLGKDIATEIESVGRRHQCYTSREQTAFHARILKDNVPLALEMVDDILVNSISKRPNSSASAK